MIHGLVAPTKEEVLGINSRQELALMERIYQRRLAESLMDQGVTVIDPDRLDIRGKVTAGRDCVLDINVVLEGVVVELAHGVVGARREADAQHRICFTKSH